MEIAAKTAYSGARIRFPAGERPFRPQIRSRSHRNSGGGGPGFSRAVAILLAKTGARARQSGSGRGGNRVSRSAHPAWAYAQRVVIKARVVRHSGRRGSSKLADHVDYIERDGVDKNGEKGRAFGVEDYLTEEEVEKFQDRAKEDRHHFRFIISPEHGADLDLQTYTRELMIQAEADLGTSLDWLAVEHHNTDNPHVHLVVRGVDERGADLVIAREYISRGLRERAQEIATRHLGPRLDDEIARERAAQLRADRVTWLDRALLKDVGEQSPYVDVRPPTGRVPDFREEQRLAKIARLHHLESLGLAAELRPGQWELDPELLEKLTTLSRRAELVKQLEQHAGPQFVFRDIDVYRKDDEPRPAEVIGEVVGRGKIDELAENDYLLVASVEGQTAGTVFRVPLSQFSEYEDSRAKPGQVVRVGIYERPPISPADYNIIREAANNGGVYSTERHYEYAKQRWRDLGREDDPAEYIERHVKRLEGHERRGLAKKLGDGVYEVPSDLEDKLEKLAAAQRDRGRFIQVSELSPLTLKEQSFAVGATWLDGRLAQGEHLTELPPGASTGERDVAQALRTRVVELERRGYDVAKRALAGHEIERLYSEEISQVAQRLNRAYGAHLSIESIPETARGARRLAGRVAQVETLSSGAHTVIVTSEGFYMVPARGRVGRQPGQYVSVEITAGAARDITRPRALQMNVRFAELDRERAMQRGR